MKPYIPGLILGAAIIYLYEFTGEVTAPIADPTGFVDNAINGADMNQQAINLAAGLATIRHFETGDGPDAYTELYGGSHFIGFADHPRIAKPIGNTGNYSTAAGAYQILAISKTPRGMTKINTWDRIKAKLNLPDFSPASQDAAAVELIKERGGYYPLINGDFSTFMDKIKLEWASVPGSPYGQSDTSPQLYADTFSKFGGVIENV